MEQSRTSRRLTGAKTKTWLWLQVVPGGRTTLIRTRDKRFQWVNTTGASAAQERCAAVLKVVELYVPQVIGCMKVSCEHGVGVFLSFPLGLP